VQRFPIRFRKDGNGANAELLTRAIYAQRDLATVGDENLLENGDLPCKRR
jgi:hypothetical protein